MIGGTERATMELVAARLGVNPDDLHKLITFESGWNPRAKNPHSSARGLLQWTDTTARGLGFSDSLDLVKKNPSVLDQLSIVEKYLSKYKPFSGKQSLYMAVFYPAARNWQPSRPFPANVQKVNPGIRTPGDYIAFVERRLLSTFAMIPLVLTGAIIVYTLLKGRSF